MEHIKTNFEEIETRINAAVKRANRRPENITFVGVSKTVSLAEIDYAAALGVKVFGENKAQELLKKHGQTALPADWHFIGHLQTNKVKQIITKAAMIESVDSERLAREIGRCAVQEGIVMEILAEINIAEEPQKYGVSPDRALSFVKEISQIEGICVKGLMCVAPFVDSPEKNRPFFIKMRNLLVDISAKTGDNVSMEHLSMGMTGDYEPAIEEGATIIRVGTGLFGERTRY